MANDYKGGLGETGLEYLLGIGFALFMFGTITGVELYKSILEGNWRWELNELNKRRQYVLTRKEEFSQELKKPENRFNSALQDSVIKYEREHFSLEDKITKIASKIYWLKITT